MSITTVIIVALIALISGFVAGFYTSKFVKSSKEEQVKTIKNILLYLVAIAEKELGAGTGPLKLAKVYDEFVAQYPQLAEVVTYEQFAKIVDEVLDEFKNILNSNEAIDKFIKEESTEKEAKNEY